MKRTTPKLTLHRETLIHLDSRHLAAAAGGIATGAVCKTVSCGGTCPTACNSRATQCF